MKAVRGILLGLFFCTTGASIDLQLLHDQLPVVLGLVVGLIGVKSLLISLIGPIFGLSRFVSMSCCEHMYQVYPLVCMS